MKRMGQVVTYIMPWCQLGTVIERHSTFDTLYGVKSWNDGLTYWLWEADLDRHNLFARKRK